MVVLPPPRSETVDCGLQPKTRLEYFLNKIAENGGSGSGNDSGLVLELTEENQILVPDGSLKFACMYTLSDGREELAKLDPGAYFCTVSAPGNPVIVRRPSEAPDAVDGEVINELLTGSTPFVLRPVPELNPNLDVQKVYTLKSELRGYMVRTQNEGWTVVFDKPEFVEGYIEAGR